MDEMEVETVKSSARAHPEVTEEPGAPRVQALQFDCSYGMTGLRPSAHPGQAAQAQAKSVL